jgi:hypothetical protein
MNTQTQYEGLIAFFSPDKNFGFISHRDSSGQVSQFFFHAARLVSCEVETKDIKRGMFARFSVSKTPPKPGNLPYAVSIQIYKNDPALAGIESLAGVTSSTEVSK